MPVRKIVTMSSRVPAGTVTPGYSTGMSRADSGSCTTAGTACRPDGFDALNRSFAPSGATTSFTSGMPRRETCVNLPLFLTLPSPNTLVGPPLGARPHADDRVVARHESAIGTWSTTLCTLKPARPSTRPASASGIACALVQRPQAEQVEHRPEVDEERVVAGTGEGLPTAVDRTSPRPASAS